jgi:UDP-GlcNAc:undecaprenyl-phosphate/decaprenyl-phosphate GlcNAc-1-phosphate transferase
MDNSMQFLPALVVGFTASLGLTPLSRQIAMRLGVVDKPNHRKIHKDHKPLMGGLAIFLAFALALLLFSPARYLAQFGAVLGGSTILCITGLLDDRYNLSPRTRFLVMIAAACMLILADIHVNFFGNPLLDYPITIFWVVAITNALNFLDNMDGLSAGLASIGAAFFLLIALSQQLSLVSILAAALLGSAVGFLIYNFNPASTFMGDMGALVLGFVLATLAMKIDYWMPPLSPYWLIPALPLMIPIFDINLVVFTRLSEGRSPMQAGKDHTSHRLMTLGLTQRQTLLLMYGAAVFFGVVGLSLRAAPETVAWLIAGLLAVLIVVMYAVMIFIRNRYQKG